MGILATFLAGVALAGATTFSVVQAASSSPSGVAPVTQTVAYDDGK